MPNAGAPADERPVLLQQRAGTALAAGAGSLLKARSASASPLPRLDMPCLRWTLQ